MGTDELDVPPGWTQTPSLALPHHRARPVAATLLQICAATLRDVPTHAYHQLLPCKHRASHRHLVLHLPGYQLFCRRLQARLPPRRHLPGVPPLPLLLPLAAGWPHHASRHILPPNQARARDQRTPPLQGVVAGHPWHHEESRRCRLPGTVQRLDFLHARCLFGLRMSDGAAGFQHADLPGLQRLQ